MKIKDTTIEFEPIEERHLGLIEGCLKEQDYQKLHTETIRRLIQTCRYLYQDYTFLHLPKIRQALIKEGLIFPETPQELKLFEKYHAE